MSNTSNTAPENTLELKSKITGTIIKTTLAGAVVDIENVLPGVIHISQLSKDPVNRVEDVVQQGQVVEVWVRRIRKDSIELTMIEPLALEWREIKPEMIVKGKVVRIESYGAFIDIGAERPGLVHVSEVTHGYIKTPSEVVKEGEEVEAQVLEVNRRKKQIRLSIKAVLPKPDEILAEAMEGSRKRKSNKGKNKGRTEDQVDDVAPTEPEPTSMEMAWREALARAENGEESDSLKEESSKGSQEQEDILNRTLENRVATG